MTKGRFSLLLLPLFVVGVAGCLRSSSTPASLSGTVTYKGSPVTAGTIRFYPKDGGMYTAVIRPDGKYEAPDLPVGEMAVTIETESANPNRKTPDYNSPGGGGMGMYGKAGGGAPQQKDRAMKMSPIPEGAPKAEGAYVKIPAKYADKSTSGLSVTLNKGKQTKDFALTD